MMFGRFPLYRQHDRMDCGPACLRMIAKHYGRSHSLAHLRSLCQVSVEGASLLQMSRAAEQIGFRTLAARVDFATLREKLPLPCIVFWNALHFVVVHKVTARAVHVADPNRGHLTLTPEEFVPRWTSDGTDGKGVVLLLEPTARFFEEPDRGATSGGLWSLVDYVRPYTRLVWQLFLGLLLGSLIQLLLPFLTQAIVDKGIGNRSVSFVWLILAGQVVLLASRTGVEFIRRWILLHLSTRINIALISDFLYRLVRLPLSFFEARTTGDLLQRIEDHGRVERFLSMSSLSVLFSMFNLVVFGVVLGLYHVPVLLVFLAGSVLYVLYVLLFLGRRRRLDFERFGELATQQNLLLQITQGIQEIKLNNCEQEKRWDWERGQARLFRVNVKAMTLSQYQQTGAFVINEAKNVLVTAMAAMAVIEGSMTLGMMLAVQYIVGQMNAPLNEFVGFIQEMQDARISLERIGDISEHEPEQRASAASVPPPSRAATIRLRNVSFRYPATSGPDVLRDVSFDIEAGKTTAVVGASGSGKTTLLKLLLRFHAPASGEITVGDSQLAALDVEGWRSVCGAVMQNGYVFADTIARNIALREGPLDAERLRLVAQLANIDSFVRTLRLGYDTVIGSDGIQLSEGQRQRVLIARALYRNPQYLFFDEATSSLDATNERSIMEGLYSLSGSKTMLVVAHRLSTVQRADRIVVLDGGCVVQTGTHDELVRSGGPYLELIRNQLQLNERAELAGAAPVG